MSNILTNSKVAESMDNLELRARKGDPWAQAELQSRCMQFANFVMDDVRQGADMQERSKLLKG